MKQLLLTLFCSFLMFNFFAADYIVDFLNDTKVARNYRSERVKGNKYGGDYFQIFYPVLRNNDWKGEEKVNENINNLAIHMAMSQEVHDRFMKYFFENLTYLFEMEYKDELEGEPNPYIDLLDSFYPDDVGIDLDIISLNNHIIVVNCIIDYNASRGKHSTYYKNLQYEELAYFDLNTGEQIDPVTFINPNKLEVFHAEAYSKISEEATEFITMEDVKNGKPVFKGASFYYVVKGNSDATFQSDYNYHVRFELEEIQPYLNKKGGYSAYLKHHKSAPPIVCSMTMDRFGNSNNWYSRDYRQIQNINELLEEPINGKFRATLAYKWKDDNTKYLKYKNTFNKAGYITTQLKYESDGDLEDSIVFHYYDNNVIKMIQFFDVDYIKEYQNDPDYEELDWWEDLWYFDEKGNMTLYEGTYDTWNEYDQDYMEHEVMHYSYFGDKVFVDCSYRCKYGTGMTEGEEFYVIQNGYAIKTTRYLTNKKMEYKIQQKGKELIFNNTHYKDTMLFILQLKSDRIVSCTIDANADWSFKVEYNNDGSPTLYETERINEKGTNGNGYKCTYDKNGNPIEHIRYSLHNKKVTKTRRISIEYEKR